MSNWPPLTHQDVQDAVVARAVITDIGKPGTSTGDALAVLGPPPSGDTTGATDTAAINSALTSTAANIILRAGDYYINATLNLGHTSGIIGSGQQMTRLRWAGAAGGKVISTAALAGQFDTGWFGSLRDFKIVYPVASVASGSRGIYIAQPHGPISGVVIDTGETTTSTGVTGAYGLELDGCGNPGGPFPVDVNVLGRWVGGVYARCNHAVMTVGFAYGDWAIVMNDDSIVTPAGPPYNLAVVDLHAFQAGKGAVDVMRIISTNVMGGLNEGTGVGLQVENGAGGLVSVGGLTTTSGTHLKHYDPTCIVTVDNPQTLDRNRYTGTATTGVLVPLGREVVRRKIATVSASGTTTGPTVVTWLGSIQNGPLGQFDCTYLGNAQSNTTAQNWTVGIYQCTSQPTNGSALPAGSTLVTSYTTAGATANVPAAVSLAAQLTGQNTTCWFAVTVTITGGGAAVGQTTGQLVVEAS